MTNDERERVRRAAYRRVDLWIEADRDLEVAAASGDDDAVSVADQARHEAAMEVADLVAGDMLRDSMWLEALSRPDDEITPPEALAMIRQFLIDTAALSVPQAVRMFVDAYDRQLGVANDAWQTP
jgi:hypothetical protein